MCQKVAAALLLMVSGFTRPVVIVPVQPIKEMAVAAQAVPGEGHMLAEQRNADVI